MAHVLIGGTFSGLHRGHREFLAKAFGIGGDVLVCLTSDAMVKKKHLPEKIASYAARERALAGFLRSCGWLRRARIVKIEDPFSEALRHPGLTHIVVSGETERNAQKINAMREKKHLSPLQIVVVKWALAQDGVPISGRRIRNGEIDEMGTLLPSAQARKPSKRERSEISPA